MAPILITPSGKEIELQVEGNVPYLLSASPAAPAASPRRPVPGPELPPPGSGKWERRGNLLVRVHNTPRRSLFCPLVDRDVTVDGMVIRFDRIGRLRQTDMTFGDKSAVRRVDLDWKDDRVSRLPQVGAWTGESRFPILAD